MQLVDKASKTGRVCKLIAEISDLRESAEVNIDILSTPESDPNCDISEAMNRAVDHLKVAQERMMRVLDIVRAGK